MLDDALRRLGINSLKEMGKTVLILLMLDDALRRALENGKTTITQGLNPSYAG